MRLRVNNGERGTTEPSRATMSVPACSCMLLIDDCDDSVSDGGR